MANPYRYYTWKITYGDIWPLGVKQQDVAGKILTFAQKDSRGICVLSANGFVSNVTICRPGSSGGLFKHEFEDFANHNAFDLLAKYGSSHLVFNVDIQGTTCVVLAGLMASLNLVGGMLSDHTFLFLRAGEAGTGIAELVALEMSKQTLEETRKKIWLVDSKGTEHLLLVYGPTNKQVLGETKEDNR